MKYFILFLVLPIFINGCIQASLMPDQVIEQKDSLLDQEITLEGTADDEQIICTSLECPEDNPCCNSCAGSLILKDKEEKITIIGQYKEKEIGCTGNDCVQVCYPLEKGKKYEVKGIWKKTNKEYYLELENFRSLE